MPFSVASYNILANSYVNPDRYPASPPEALDPAFRLATLVRRLMDLGADVVCLQEVEPVVFEYLDLRLKTLNYEGHFAKKGGGKPDGCATFFNKSTFALWASRLFHFTDGRGSQPPSGHVALLLVLLDREDRHVGIANTHLKWDPPGTPLEEQWGFRQARQLLEEREVMDPGCRAWVLCGDLNVTPDSETIRMVRRVGLDYAHRGREHLATCKAQAHAKMVDYLLHTRALAARPVDPPPIDEQTPLPSDCEPSDHVAVTAWFDWAKPEL
jgi:mRNA deadenylase 3'-5' endonuclease subunit Ccr4